MQSTKNVTKVMVTRATRLARNLGVVGLLAFAMTCAVHAEPLVRMEDDTPKPGVVTEWEAKGKKKVLLTVREDVDPKDVAEQIATDVPKVRAKVRGGKVQVVGKDEGTLLKALSEVEYGEEDDGDDAFAAAEIGEDDALGSGSSMRAKKVAELEALLADQTTVALGRVVKVGHGAFPEATVWVRIIRGPKGALGEAVKKGRTLAFSPNLARGADGTIDWSNSQTQANAGAWFLAAQDQVRVKIGAKRGDGFTAEIIARQ